MRNIRFHFAKDGKTFCVSCPYGISRKSLQDSINKFFPKMLKKMAYEPPYTTDEVYLFGVKTSYPGFGALPEKERAKILKAKLLEFVTPKVREYESQMGVKKPYRVRVRSMESRYGVNSQRTHALTFTTALGTSEWSIIAVAPKRSPSRGFGLRRVTFRVGVPPWYL